MSYVIVFVLLEATITVCITTSHYVTILGSNWVIMYNVRRDVYTLVWF